MLSNAMQLCPSLCDFIRFVVFFLCLSRFIMCLVCWYLCQAIGWKDFCKETSSGWRTKTRSWSDILESFVVNCNSSSSWLLAVNRHDVTSFVSAVKRLQTVDVKSMLRCLSFWHCYVILLRQMVNFFHGGTSLVLHLGRGEDGEVFQCRPGDWLATGVADLHRVPNPCVCLIPVKTFFWSNMCCWPVASIPPNLESKFAPPPSWSFLFPHFH